MELNKKKKSSEKEGEEGNEEEKSYRSPAVITVDWIKISDHSLSHV